MVLMLLSHQLHLGLVIQLVFPPHCHSWYHKSQWFDVRIHNINAQNTVWCSKISLVINNSLVENFELFPMMITIHQRNLKVSNDDDTVSKSAQNSLPWVLPDKFITDRLTILLILSLLALFSLFLPSTNIPLFKKCNVLLSLVINNSPMNRFPISNSTYVQSSCVKYIPLFCWIWPGFIQKSSLFYQQSLGMMQTHVTIFLKSPYSLDDKIRATVQLITYTVTTANTQRLPSRLPFCLPQQRACIVFPLSPVTMYQS